MWNCLAYNMMNENLTLSFITLMMCSSFSPQMNHIHIGTINATDLCQLKIQQKKNAIQETENW